MFYGVKLSAQGRKDIKLKACPRPPGKEILLEKFKQIVEDKGWKTVGIDENHFPDMRWLLAMISTHNPNDEIFNKDYLPPVKKNKISEVKSVHLPETFLKGLPISKKKQRRKSLKIFSEGVANQKI